MIALAWHVDYWDHLGWHDPYASHLSTERQRGYASALGKDVFTPALVVDGARMMVGSNRSAVAEAIATASPLPLQLAHDRTAPGAVTTISAAPGPAIALFATYDPERVTPVGAGENDGRQLREFRIVRAAKVLAAWDGAPRRLKLPAIASGQGAVVLVQSHDLRILGAVDIKPAGYV